MSFLNIFNKKNKKENKESSYSCDLEKQLEEYNIPFDIEENNNEILIDYIDPFDKILYKFKVNNEKIYLSNKEISLENAIKILKKQWVKDELIIKYLEDEKFNPIFEMELFFKDITSDEGLIGKFFPRKDGISLLYNITKKPTEKEYLVGVDFIIDNDNVICKILPENIRSIPTGAAIHILGKIYEEVPLFFTSGNYKVKEGTLFSDAIKTYLINLAIVNRLNEIDNVEAQITDPETANTIFVMLKNGSAIEYISPTKQHPSGKYLVIDFDEDHKVEDNDSYNIISKILKLPSLLNNKADEDNMPTRNFSKKGTRRFK